MNIRKYMTMTCDWTQRQSDDEDILGLNYDKAPVKIKCFKYSNGASFGKQSFVINPQEITIRSTTTYIVQEEGVKEGDRIDGMIVNLCDKYTDKNGKYLFSTCGVI